MTNDKYVRRLPGVFQTPVNKKFFSSTVDQVLSKKNSEFISGFIGRREGGNYDPAVTYFAKEPSKNRNSYQLEPIAYSRDPDTLESVNEVFYYDLIDRLRFYQTPVNNHDRLFEVNTYSFAPPIDIDKFLNYQDYYWIANPNDVPFLTVSNMDDAEIENNFIGSAEYTFTNGLAASSGMVVLFSGSASYNKKYRIEGVGRSIQLVEFADLTLPGNQFELLFWDFLGDINTGTGAEAWDTLPWEVRFKFLEKDYITIDRTSCDNNAWSRTNSWYHKDVLSAVIAEAGGAAPSQQARARRPIIEFLPNLELFNSGTNFKEVLRLVTDLPFATISGGNASILYDGVVLRDGDRIAFANQSSIVWVVSISANIITLISDGLATDGDIVFAAEGLKKGENFYAKNGIWVLAANQKTAANQAPLFSLYDLDGVRLDDSVEYPGSTFTGSEIFSYKINSAGVVDSETGLRLTFKSLGQISDIVFENDVTTQSFSYLLNGSLVPYTAAKFYKRIKNSECEIDEQLRSMWLASPASPKQRVKDLFEIAADAAEQTFDLSVLPYLGDVEVYRNGVITSDYTLENNKITLADLKTNEVIDIRTYGRQTCVETSTLASATSVWNLVHVPAYTDIKVFVNSAPYTAFVLDGSLISFKPALPAGSELEVQYISAEHLQEADRGFYEIPAVLEKNPANLDVDAYSYNDFASHFVSILRGQAAADVDLAIGDTTQYRDTAKDLSVGTEILRHDGSALKAMLVSENSLDLIQSIRFASQEYVRFKNKLMQTTKQMIDSNEITTFVDLNNDIEIDALFTEIVKRIQNNSEVKSTFTRSEMIAGGDVYEQEILSDYLSSLGANFVGINQEGNAVFKLATQAQIADPRTAVYLYAVDSAENLLIVDQDYRIYNDDNGDCLVEIFNDLITTSSTSVTNSFVYNNNTITRTTGSWISDGFAAGDFVTVSDTQFNNGSYQVVAVTDDVLTVSSSTEIITINNNVCSYYDNTFVANTYPFTNETAVSTVISFEINDAITLYARVYVNTLFANIPPTPSKLGIAQTYVPARIVNDTFPTPASAGSAEVIIGHDGSSTPVFGDFRDTVLLEFEKRVYNRIAAKFREVDYIPPVSAVDVVPRAYRDTNYTQEEILRVMRSNFYKWCNIQGINPRQNDYFESADVWTYNYRAFGVNETNTPGYWRGMYEFYYDTQTPHTAPWEMLGFTQKPAWWTAEYGTDFSSTNLGMWNDIEQGLIRAGERAGIDARFARPGLVASALPVDAVGSLLAPEEIGLATIPANEFDWTRDWKFGDGAPVEDWWKSTSHYAFALAELVFLTKPAKFAELCWDTLSYEIQNDLLVNTVSGNRELLADTLVHGELDEATQEIVIRIGYQQWISDLLAFNRKNIKTQFGEKVRTLSVKLGHKVAGFTNVDTLKAFVDTLSAGTNSLSDQIPVEDVEVKIFKGPSVAEFVYSGVIVKADSAGKYQVFGYDLITGEFGFNPAADTSRAIEVNVAGKEADFRLYQNGISYGKDEIVKYNSRFYRCVVAESSTTFVNSEWRVLTRLPVNGGVEATYYPQRADVTEFVEYGTTFDTTQDVFDFLVGYGSYLEKQGWKFEQVDKDTNVIKDFLEAAKQFLFWVATSWGEDNLIALSPLAKSTVLEVSAGYPASVERTSNGVYSILDENGIIVDPRLTSVDRDGRLISVTPKNEQIRLFYTRVSTQETEHIVTFSNQTSFGDVIYDPVLGARQAKIKLNFFRTNDWIGKYEAPGYIIIDGNVVPNFENTTNTIRDYHNTEVALDTAAVEDAARHLIGFEEQQYLVNLQISEDTQYQFYQGLIREKGTQESIRKLLRSIYVRQEQDINVYEEWAIKVSEFGATCENQRMDVVIGADEIKSDPQLVIFDTPQSAEGSVGQIVVASANQTYSTVPAVQILPGLDETNTQNILPARAIAVLTAEGNICRIDVIYAGGGYTVTPRVLIAGQPDQAIAVLQRSVTADFAFDDILYIDVDDADRWIYRPRNCDARDLWPTTANIDYNMPNAGYVNIADVDFTAFDIDQLKDLFALDAPPKIHQTPVDETTWASGASDTVWVARNPFNTWAVYRLQNLGDAFFIDEQGDGNIIETVFEINTDNNDQTTLPGYFVLNERRLTDETTLAFEQQIRLVKIRVSATPATVLSYRYDIIDDNGNPLKLAPEVEDLFAAEIWVLQNARFATIADRNAAMTNAVSNELSWIDNNGDDQWEVQIKTDADTWVTYVASTTYNNTASLAERKQELLVDTTKFKNAFIYDKTTKQTIYRLAVVDPFKGILPGIAEQNISFKSSIDPAKYTFAADAAMIDLDDPFAPSNTGLTWLDTSGFAFLYYEQGTNYERRNQWGRLFPGSDVAVYEWTRSLVLPSQYTGPGTPKNTTDYVSRREFESTVGQEVSVYYFWVRGKDTVPESIASRTISTVATEQLISNFRKQNYQWFAPVNAHGDDSQNALVFGNASANVSSSDTVLQINYKYTSKDTNVHTEWHLMRENDQRSLVLDQHWNKLVDSLVGMTAEIAWNQPTPGFVPTSSGLGYLTVPDPALSAAERYGINYRPRQTMFANLQVARKVFVESANAILENTQIRRDTAWADQATASSLWEWTTWYAEGFNRQNVVPVKQVSNTAELFLSTDGLRVGDIVRVFNKLVSAPAAYYRYNAEGTFDEVARERETIRLTKQIYTSPCSPRDNLRIHVALRALIEDLTSLVFLRDRAVAKNSIFFAMLRYALSEFREIDWAFKTTYILLEQSGQELVQTLGVEANTLPSTIDYINAVKPYHTKIRDYTQIRNAGIDLASGSASDFRNTKITITFNRVDDSECQASSFDRDAGEFNSEPRIPWDLGGWDICPWDGDGLIAYYSSSDEDNSNLFAAIEPDQTVTANSTVSVIPLTFDVASFESGPFVFVDGVQQMSTSYDAEANTVTLATPAAPGSTIEIFNVMPFDGNGFAAGSCAEELAVGRANDSLIITIDTNPVKRYEICDVVLGKYRYFLPFGVSDSPSENVLIDSIKVFVDGLDVTGTSAYQIVSDSAGIDPWGELWSGEDCNAPWDATLGIQFTIESLAGASIVEFCYEIEANLDRYSHRIYVDRNGLISGYRVCDSEAGELIDAVTTSSTEISVSLALGSSLPDATYAAPGAVWIGTELVEYGSIQVSGNTAILSGLRRGVSSTVVSQQHNVGSKVISAATTTLIPDFDTLAENTDLSNQQLEFLTSCPGTYISNICDEEVTD